MAVTFDSQKLPKSFESVSQDGAIEFGLGEERTIVESQINYERIQKITQQLHRELVTLQRNRMGHV